MKYFSILILTLLVMIPQIVEANPLRALLTEREYLREMVNKPTLQVPNKTLRKGDSGFEVLILSQRLGQIYSGVPQTSEFDTVLDDFVKLYQSDNNLGVDGIVGPVTRASLNISYADRLRAVERSIEAVRHINFAQRDIIVNIPSMTLTAYEAAQPVLFSRVVVGHPQRKTPLMSSRAFSIKYNPDWTVPPGITRRYRAKLAAEGPGYFQKKGIQIRYVDGQATFWQPPGPSSALGLLKFELDNNQNIYLHDTNERSLFNRDDRARSSGCVRVQNYLELASWLLQNSVAHVERGIATKRTYWERVSNPVMVHMVYALAWPNENGVITYHQDIYNRY